MRSLGAAAFAACLLACARGGAPAPRPPARGAGADPGPQLLAFLDDALGWYRQVAAQAQAASDPAEEALADATRRQAREAARQAFAFARAEVALRPEPAASPRPGAAAGALGADGARQLAADAAAAAQRAQAEVEALARTAQAATGPARATAQAQLLEGKSELGLAQARREALDELAGLLARPGAATGAGGLLGQLQDLERSAPELAAEEPRPAAAAAAPPSLARRPAAGGVVALAGDLAGALRQERSLRELARRAAGLRAAVDRLRGPLLAELRGTLQAGDALSAAPQTEDLDVLAGRRRDLDRLTAHFRAVSAALAPLARQAMLLDGAQGGLADWRAGADARFDTALRALALRLGVLALAIGLVLAASAAWRRATFRYVRDLRRRQQSLLVRRVVVGITLAAVIAFSLVTELGSIATVAGFLTAGLAVALQNVILSFVAYFFLVGRYGVRTGDRVQVGGVVGDVLEVGLVRLHLLELGPDAQPTGRVVVFSNAVLFQPGASFVKQLPGSAFAWHQVRLTLSSATDYLRAERRLLDAVDGVYAQYRDRIAAQHAEVEQNVSIAVREPRPESQLRLGEGGLEMTIRFPVPLEAATAVDDQVTRALLAAIDREPRLRLADAGTPTLQAAPEPAPT